MIFLFLAAQKVPLMDVIFVVEGSEKVGPAGFKDIKDFVKNTIDKYTIGDKSTLVGMVEYSDAPRIIFTVDEYTTKSLLNAAVDKVLSSRGKTADTAKALEVAKEMLNITSKGRLGAAKVVILVTRSAVKDKHSLERVLNKTKESKAQLYVIAIGDEDIAIGDNQINVDDSEDTGDVVDNIVETIAKDVKKGKLEKKKFCSHFHDNIFRSKSTVYKIMNKIWLMHRLATC